MKSKSLKPRQLQVDIANLQQHITVNSRRLRSALRRVFADAGICRGGVSLALVDNDTISKLNQKYLGRRGPTDVLAFRLDEEEDAPGPPPLWGEIVVSAEEAKLCAHQRRARVEAELMLYVVHGGLHLLGFDHTRAAERKKMEAKQKHYLDLFLKSKQPRGSTPTPRCPRASSKIDPRKEDQS